MAPRAEPAIDGPASFAYRVDDSFSSVPLARRNLKSADGVKVTEADGKLQLSIALRRAAVWGWRLDIGPWTPQQDVAVPTWLPEIMDRRRSPNPARDMLLSAWNGGHGYRWALLQGTGDDFELDVDPQPTARTESLVRLYRLPASSWLSGQLTVERLVAQPIDQPWWHSQQVELASFQFRDSMFRTSRAPMPRSRRALAFRRCGTACACWRCLTATKPLTRRATGNR